MTATSAEATEYTHSQVRVPKAAEMIAGVLRRQIVDGTFAEGAPLPSEADLIGHFGVSRPSIREALRILESERLITVRRGARGGVRASRPTVAVAAGYLGAMMQMDGVHLADVYTARAAIEPEAVRMLAGRSDRKQGVGELRAMLQAQRDDWNDARKFAVHISRFHQRLVELSGNKTLALLWGTLHEVLAGEVLDVVVGGSGRMTHKKLDAREELIGHVLDLVDAGKADAAHDAWREQMLTASRAVLKQHGSKTLADILE